MIGTYKSFKDVNYIKTSLYTKYWVFRALRNPLMLGRAKLKQF